MNVVVLDGFVGQDVEVKEVGSEGNKVCNFSLANSRYVGNGRGDNGGNFETVWFQGAAWNNWAEWLGRNVNKGTMITIQAEVRNNKYEKDGVEKQSMQLVNIKEIKLNAKPVPRGDGNNNNAPQPGW